LPALVAVADGMGGEANGAAVAYETVRNLEKLSLPATKEALENYLLDCNALVCKMIDESNGVRMGSTFSAVSFHDGNADVVNIGDSRIYLFRNLELRRLSRDHTVLQPLIDAGVLTAEQARTHPRRHVLTQHIGIFPDELIIEPHRESIKVKSGDIFLICSDGLTDAANDDEIAAILSKNCSIDQTCKELHRAALLNTKDNVTIIVIQLS